VAIDRVFPSDEWQRLRLVVFAASLVGLVLASTGVLVTTLFHQPTTIKYAVTVAGFGFVAVLATVRAPLRLLVGIAVFVAPINAVFTVQGAQLTPLLVIDVLGLFAALPRLGATGSRLKPAAAIFALLLLPAIAGADSPGHWAVWLSITLITGWLTFLIAREPDGTRYVIQAVLVSALFQALVAIWEFRTKHQLNLYGASGSQAAGGQAFFLYGRLLRPSGTLPDPIGLGQVLALYLPLIVAYAASIRRVAGSFAIMCIGGLTALALALSLSRLSIIGGGVGLLVTLLALPGRRWRLGVMVAVISVVVISLALALGGSSLKARFDSILHPTAAHVRTAAGDVTRTHIWNSALRIGEAHPVTGVGIGNIANYLPRYGVPVKQGANGQNTPLQFFAEGGLPGVIALLAVVVAAFLDLFRSARAHRLWAAGCFGALVATLFTWSTDVEVRLAPVSATVAILLGIIAAMASQRSTPADPRSQVFEPAHTPPG
jgi:O-antigen ligase